MGKAFLSVFVCCASVALAQSTVRWNENPKTYRYSVVSGGIWSEAGFVNAETLPVVADHYAALRSLAIAQLRRQDSLYVSYRKGGLIYWTAARLSVPAHEYVWVSRNGQMVRARCGNRLSRFAQTPVLPVGSAATPHDLEEEIPGIPSLGALMPPRPDLDAQLAGPPFLPLDLPTAQPPVALLGPGGYLFWPPLYGASGAWIVDGYAVPASVASPVVTPEPATAGLLLAAGLLALLGIRRRS